MSKQQRATKAIILSRVSSKEQEEGYSIDAQTFRLQEYCTRKGLGIIKTFEFSESSTNGSRKKFNEAIKFAKQQNDITAIITDKVDRLQRSYKETPILDSLIQKDKIELHFCTENLIIHKNSTSQERMVWNMCVMMAQSYVDSLKDNVNRSIEQKLRLGEWISIAPIGYLHEKGGKNERGKGTIVIDQERAPLIKKLFEEFATGLYTMPKLRKKVKEWGLTNSRGNQGDLCLSHLHSIIQNPFYYGMMRIEKTGKEYPHIYEPIISKELFDACQLVRLGRSKKPFKWAKKEYIFKGLITCSATGRMATSMTKNKKYLNGTTAEWVYLRVWDKANPKKEIYVQESEILKQIEEVFKSMKLDPEMLEKVIGYIKASSKNEQDYHKSCLASLNAEKTKIKTRIERLTDLYLDGEMSKDEYEEKRQQLTQKREEITKQIANHDKADDNFAECLKRLVELASRAYDTFKSSTIEEKRQLISFVFGNLKLNGHKLEYTLRSPFDGFVETAKNGEWWALVDRLRRNLHSRITFFSPPLKDKIGHFLDYP